MFEKVEVSLSTEGDGEEEIMERRETVFDGKRNDWIAFATQQEQFYRDIKQYMVNLQLDIQEIEVQMEETLKQIEDANANVTQGYRLFRMIKDLRIRKKEKMEELSQLEWLTDYVDCGYLYDTYKYNLEQMKAAAGAESEAEMMAETSEVSVSEPKILENLAV